MLILRSDLRKESRAYLFESLLLTIYREDFSPFSLQFSSISDIPTSSESTTETYQLRFSITVIMQYLSVLSLLLAIAAISTALPTVEDTKATAANTVTALQANGCNVLSEWKE
jgi:hypothetical protein